MLQFFRTIRFDITVRYTSSRTVLYESTIIFIYLNRTNFAPSKVVRLESHDHDKYNEGATKRVFAKS